MRQKEVGGTPLLADQMPRLPEQLTYAQDPDLTTEKSESMTAQQLERQEVSELQEVYQHLNLLYSKLSQTHRVLSEFGLAQSDNHPQILNNAVVKVEEARNLLHSVQAESGATKEKGILLKRKLMQHHELHSDIELLKIQADAFQAISEIRSHLGRVEEVIDLVVLTANEFIHGTARNSIIDLNIKDEMREVDLQIEHSCKLISRIMGHILTVKQMEEELEEVGLHEIVHHDLQLEIQDLKKIASIFNNVYHIFANAVRKQNINSLTATSVKRDPFKAYSNLLHHKILPIVQKCMRYEEGLFNAAKDINERILQLMHTDERMEQETIHISSIQTEIRLFASNLRTTFTELNSNMPDMLEHLDEEINAMLESKGRTHNKIEKLAQQSRLANLTQHIHDGKMVIKKILEMLDFMRRNTHAMYYYMASAEKSAALPSLPQQPSSDKRQS